MFVCLSVCLSGISSAVYGPIQAHRSKCTLLGIVIAEKATFMSVCAVESQLGTPLAVSQWEIIIKYCANQPFDTVSVPNSTILHRCRKIEKPFFSCIVDDVGDATPLTHNTGQVAIVPVGLSITVSCCHLGINHPVFSGTMATCPVITQDMLYQ